MARRTVSSCMTTFNEEEVTMGTTADLNAIKVPYGVDGTTISIAAMAHSAEVHIDELLKIEAALLVISELLGKTTPRGLDGFYLSGLKTIIDGLMDKFANVSVESAVLRDVLKDVGKDAHGLVY